MKWIGLNINLFKHYGNQLRTNFCLFFTSLHSTQGRIFIISLGGVWTNHGGGVICSLITGSLGGASRRLTRANFFPGIGLLARRNFAHYKQALWRKMQAFDLVPEYHVLSSPVRKAFKMIWAPPFVEPGSVVEFWDVLKANCPSDMDAFCDYFEYTWIGNSTRVPVFEKFLWNQYDTVLANLPRSNNMVEGWHNGFQSLVGTTNPTLWTFLSALKKEETLTFKKKVDWRMRRAPEPQKKKWRDHNSRLNALVEDFDIDTEPLDYLFCLGELLSSV